MRADDGVHLHRHRRPGANAIHVIITRAAGWGEELISLAQRGRFEVALGSAVSKQRFIRNLAVLGCETAWQGSQPQRVLRPARPPGQ